MRLKHAFFLFLGTTLIFSGCSGGGGGGSDTDSPQTSETKSAALTIAEYSARKELLTLQFLSLVTGNFTQEVMTTTPEEFSGYYEDGSLITVYDSDGNACTIVDQSCDAEQIYADNYILRFNEFMENRDALAAMQDDVDAALQTMGITDETTVAGALMSKGVKDWLYEKTFFGDKDRKTLATVITHVIENDEGSIYTNALWEEIQAGGYGRDAANLDEWRGKLDSGELDGSAFNLYKRLMEATDEDGYEYFGEAAVATDNKRSDVAKRNGAYAVNVVYEIGKVSAEVYIPGVGLVNKVFDSVQQWNDYLQKIKDGKITEVAKEIIIDKVTKKLGGFAEDTMEASRLGKKVNQVYKSAQEKYENISKIEKILNPDQENDDASAASGLTISEITPIANAAREDGLKNATVVISRPTPETLTEQSQARQAPTYTPTTYTDEDGQTVTTDIPSDAEDGFLADIPEIIIGLIPDSDLFDLDLYPSDFAFPIDPGDYDVTVTDSEGHMVTTPEVTVTAETITPVVIDTAAETHGEEYEPTETALTVNSTQAADGEWTVEVTVSHAFIPDYALIVSTNGSGLLDRDGVIVGNDLRFTVTTNTFTFQYTPNSDSGNEHVLTIDLEDVLGQTASVTERLVLETADDQSQESATFQGDAGFVDDDLNTWTLTVEVTFNSFGTLSGSVSGNVYMVDANATFPVTGTVTGTWSSGAFTAGGTITISTPEGSQNIDFDYTGSISDLSAQSISGTIYSDGAALKTFNAQRVQ